MNSENPNRKPPICEIRCNKHIGWFPSPIYFGTKDLFKKVVTEGNMVNCPFSGEDAIEMITCDKSNMRFRYINENGVPTVCYYDENGMMKEYEDTPDDEDTDEDEENT